MAEAVPTAAMEVATCRVTERTIERRPEHASSIPDRSRSRPPNASTVEENRAKRAFFLALARHSCDMLAVAQEVWDVAVVKAAALTPMPGGAENRNAIRIFSQLAKGEHDRDRITKTEMTQFVSALQRLAAEYPAIRASHAAATQAAAA